MTATKPTVAPLVVSKRFASGHVGIVVFDRHDRWSAMGAAEQWQRQGLCSVVEAVEVQLSIWLACGLRGWNDGN